MQQTGGNVTLIQSQVGGNVHFNGGRHVHHRPRHDHRAIYRQETFSGPTARTGCGSTVKGNLQFQNNGTVEIGSASPCAGNTIGGNLSVQKQTHGSAIVVGNAVSGNLQDRNTALTQVFSNVVGKNLQCQNNNSRTCRWRQYGRWESRPEQRRPV